jgi:hypothetical protein
LNFKFKLDAAGKMMAGKVIKDKGKDGRQQEKGAAKFKHKVKSKEK